MTLQLSHPGLPAADLLAARKPQRHRHELRFRHTRVTAVESVSAHMLRVSVQGEDLADFVSLGFDDHVKLLFPDAHGELPDLRAGLEGITAEMRASMRDYTPHSFDPDQCTLSLDFVLHDAGPATAWAMQARPGQPLVVAGPRGSFTVSTEFDGHLLIGDETALPAVARRLAELPTTAQACVVIEVGSAGDEQELHGRSDLQVHWVHRGARAAGQSEGLVHALDGLSLPVGDYYCWVAAEAGVARDLRQALVTRHGANPKWTKAAAYWKHGSVGVHEVIED